MPPDEVTVIGDDDMMAFADALAASTAARGDTPEMNDRQSKKATALQKQERRGARAQEQKRLALEDHARDVAADAIREEKRALRAAAVGTKAARARVLDAKSDVDVKKAAITEASRAGHGQFMAGVTKLRRDTEASEARIKGSNERRYKQREKLEAAQEEEKAVLLSKGMNPYKEWRSREMNDKAEAQRAAAQRKRDESGAQVRDQLAREMRYTAKKDGVKNEEKAYERHFQKEMGVAAKNARLNSYMLKTCVDPATGEGAALLDPTSQMAKIHPSKHTVMKTWRFGLDLAGPGREFTDALTGDALIQEAEMRERQEANKRLGGMLGTANFADLEAVAGLGSSSSKATSLGGLSSIGQGGAGGGGDTAQDKKRALAAKAAASAATAAKKAANAEGNATFSRVAAGNRKDKPKGAGRFLGASRPDAVRKDFPGMTTFTSTPAKIIFEDLDVDRSMSSKFVITCTSPEYNTFKLLDLDPSYCDFFEITYKPPGRMRGGTTCSLHIKFTPKENKDIFGVIPFQTETGRFEVPFKCLTKKTIVSFRTFPADTSQPKVLVRDLTTGAYPDLDRAVTTLDPVFMDSDRRHGETARVELESGEMKVRFKDKLYDVAWLSDPPSAETDKGGEGVPLVSCEERCGGEVELGNGLRFENLEPFFPKTTCTDLQATFKKFGSVVDVSLMEDEDGEATGLGFVTFATSAQAEQAIKNVHHTEFNGQWVRTCKATPCLFIELEPLAGALAIEPQLAGLNGFLHREAHKIADGSYFDDEGTLLADLWELDEESLAEVERDCATIFLSFEALLGEECTRTLFLSNEGANPAPVRLGTALPPAGYDADDDDAVPESTQFGLWESSTITGNVGAYSSSAIHFTFRPQSVGFVCQTIPCWRGQDNEWAGGGWQFQNAGTGGWTGVKAKNGISSGKAVWDLYIGKGSNHLVGIADGLWDGDCRGSASPDDDFAMCYSGDKKHCGAVAWTQYGGSWNGNMQHVTVEVDMELRVMNVYRAGELHATGTFPKEDRITGRWGTVYPAVATELDKGGSTMTLSNFRTTVIVYCQGEGLRVPVSVTDEVIDFNCCVYDHIYRDQVVLKNVGKTGHKFTVTPPACLKDYISLDPNQGIVQAEDSMMCKLKFTPREDMLRKVPAKYLKKVAMPDFPEMGDVYQLEVEVRFAVPTQEWPVKFLFRAQLSTSVLKFDPPSMAFGNVPLNESGSMLLRVTNQSQVKQRYGVINLPTEVKVEPPLDELLPGQSKDVTVTFEPHAAVDHTYTLRMKTDLNSDPGFPLRVSGRGVEPPLVIAPQQIKLPARAVGDTITASVFVNNTTSAPQCFQVKLPPGVPFTISPLVGVVAPKGMAKDDIYALADTEAWLKGMNSDQARLHVEWTPTQARPDTAASRAALRSSQAGGGGGAAPGTADSAQGSYADGEEGARSAPDPAAGAEGGAAGAAGAGAGEDGAAADGAAADGLADTVPSMSTLALQGPDQEGTFCVPVYIKGFGHSAIHLEVQTALMKPTLTTPEGELRKKLDFGICMVGHTKIMSVTVTNQGSEPVDLGKLRPADPFASFQLLTALSTVAPGGSLDLRYAFKPRKADKLVYEEVLAGKDGQVNAFSLLLLGEGIVPTMELTWPVGLEHRVISCGDVSTDGEKAVHSFTLENTSDYDLEYEILEKPSDATHLNFNGLSPFLIAPLKGLVPPRQKTEVAVEFAPDHESDLFATQLIVQTAGATESSKGLQRHEVLLEGCGWQGGVYVRMPSIEMAGPARRAGITVDAGREYNAFSLWEAAQADGVRADRVFDVDFTTPPLGDDFGTGGDGGEHGAEGTGGNGDHGAADDSMPTMAKCTRFLDFGNVKEKSVAGSLEIGADAIQEMLEDGFKLEINGQVQDKEVKFPLPPGTKATLEFSYAFMIAPAKSSADARSSSARTATQKAQPGSQLAKTSLSATLVGGADAAAQQPFTINLTARV